MNRDHHVVRTAGDRVVDEPAVSAGEVVGIVSPGPGLLADRRVAEVGEVGVVELEVAAAAAGQVGDLGAVGGGEVAVEVLPLKLPTDSQVGRS
jgi:hypothetical protein